jgi:hypothetical protein
MLCLAILSVLLLSGIAVQAQDAKPADVEVTVENQSDGGWPVSPLWLAIGGVALVALIALVVAASRGSSGPATTIVKER